MKTDDKQANVDAALGMYAACSVSDEELNALRIGYAQAAIDGYYVAAHEKLHGDPQEDMIDVLTDLQHWAKAKGLSFTDAVRISLSHFQDEQ